MAKQLERIEIQPAENGGHVVTHHYARKPSGKSQAFYMGEEPEKHVFGKGEHRELVAHVTSALHLPEAKEEQEEASKG